MPAPSFEIHAACGMPRLFCVCVCVLCSPGELNQDFLLLRRWALAVQLETVSTFLDRRRCSDAGGGQRVSATQRACATWWLNDAEYYVVGGMVGKGAVLD